MIPYVVWSIYQPPKHGPHKGLEWARDLGGMPLRMRKKIRIRMAPSMAIPVLNG